MSAIALPTHADIVVVTVIGTELHAILDMFGIKDEVRENPGGMGLVWRSAIQNRFSPVPITVVVHCIGQAGWTPAAAAAAKSADQFKPSMMILCGIASGVRQEC